MAETILETFVTEYLFRGDTKALDRIESRVQKTERTLSSAGAGMQKIGAALTVAAGATLMEFSQIELGFATIEGLVGTSRTELEGYRDQMSEITDETGKSIKELTDGLFFIQSAGYKGSRGMEVLRVSAKASTAEIGDMATIADLVTGVINVYGEEMINAAQAGDQLVAAIREGKLEPQTLANALSMVLPFAGELNIEFHEVAGAMAAMSKQNIKASRGAAALRGIFGKLLKPTEMGRKALAEYGLTIEEVREAAGEHGLIHALGMVRTAFGENKEAVGKVFEDQEALLGVYALTNRTMEDNIGITERVKDSQGDLDKAFKVVFGTLDRQGKKTWSNFKDAMAQVGMEIAPDAQKMLDKINELIDSFQALDGETKKLVASGLALGPVLFGLGTFLRIAAFALRGLLPVLTVGVWLFGKLRTVVGFLFALFRASPLGFFITTLILLITYWDELMGLFEDGFAAIKSWSADSELMKPIIDTMENIGEVWDRIVGMIERGVEKIKAWFAGLIPEWAKDMFAAEGEPNAPAVNPRFRGRGGMSPLVDPSIMAGNRAVAPGVVSQPPSSIRTRSNINRTVEIGEVNVTVPNGDAREISENIERTLRDEIQGVVEDQDSPIER